MSSNAAITPIYYNSTFRHGVDGKRRVQVPAKWRPSQPDVEFTLILWPNGGMPDACLLVLPPQEMADLAAKLKSMPFADPKTETLRRLLGRKSASVPLDKAGRICVPDGMAKAVGVDKEAMMVGLVDRFEIWNPERYEAASVVDEALLPEAFKLI